MKDFQVSLGEKYGPKSLIVQYFPYQPSIGIPLFMLSVAFILIKKGPEAELGKAESRRSLYTEWVDVEKHWIEMLEEGQRRRRHGEVIWGENP